MSLHFEDDFRNVVDVGFARSHTCSEYRKIKTTISAYDVDHHRTYSDRVFFSSAQQQQQQQHKGLYYYIIVYNIRSSLYRYRNAAARAPSSQHRMCTRIYCVLHAADESTLLQIIYALGTTGSVARTRRKLKGTQCIVSVSTHSSCNYACVCVCVFFSISFCFCFQYIIRTVRGVCLSALHNKRLWNLSRVVLLPGHSHCPIRRNMLPF